MATKESGRLDQILGLILIMILTKNAVKGDPNFATGGENLPGTAVVDGDTNGERTVYACNGFPLVLKCHNTNKTRGIIKVTRANFGRFSIALCNEEGRTDWSVNCFTPKAKKIISENCDDKEDCSLSADDFDLGPNPCPDTERYLEAHYICIQTALARPPDVPPWLKSSGGDYDENRPSINSRRKPERRVPITAPPTKPSSFETTTISTTTTVRERPRPETPFPDVSAAPVFYENHHASGNLDSETESSRDNFATTKTSVTESSSSSSRSLIENQISPQQIFDEDKNTFDGSTKNGSRLCPARRSRGILWLEVAVGGLARRPCPHGAEAGLQAVWECTSGRDSLPVWKSNWPDLSGCQSSWTRELETKTEAGKMEMTETADTLERQMSRGSVFGGDLDPILNLISATLTRIKAETDNDALATDDRDDQFMVLVEREVVHKMARTLSGLLDRRHVPAWHDLTDASRRRVTLDKLMSVTEEMGFVISKMSKGITRDVSDDDDDESDEKRASRDEKTSLKSSDEDEELKGPTYIVTPNIYLTTQKLGFGKPRKQMSNPSEIILPLTFPTQHHHLRDEEDEQLRQQQQHQAGLELHFETKSSNSSFESIVGVAFRNVDRILSIESVGPSDVIGTLVLSIVPRKSKTLFLRQVNYDIPLVTSSNVRNVCVAWTGRVWTSERCHFIKKNSSHVSCGCETTSTDESNLWTRFAVVSDGGQALVEAGDKFYDGGIFRSAAFDDLSTATIVIVAVSALLLVGSLLAAALLVVYCRRVKIRDKKWEDTGSRPCYLRKSATTLEVGNNDYSELGLLQQQQHQQQHQHQQIPHSHTTLLLKGHPHQSSPSSRHQRLGMLACIDANNYERSSNEGQQVNAHVNLLHSRSESDLENEVEVDRYAHYEVARPPSSYNTTMTSSSTPHLLMGENTMTRTAQNFYHQDQQQPYSAYYQSFGRTLDVERKSGKNKISNWIKTKLTRNDSSTSTGGRHMTSSSRRPQVSDYSYSGANTLLRRPSDFNVASGGGSLALLLRHKNCPADGRQFVAGERMTPRARPFHQDIDPLRHDSPTLSLRSENNFFLPDPFGNVAPRSHGGRHFRQNNFLHHTSRRPAQQPDESRLRPLGLHLVPNEAGVDERNFYPAAQWGTATPMNQQQAQRMNDIDCSIVEASFQRSNCCPAILTLPPPPPPPQCSSGMPQHSNRPSLYEDVDEKELVEQLIKSPSEQWPSGLPAPWLGEAIYQLPLDNNLEWSHLQQQQQQQQQRQNLLRFSSSSSNSEEPKVMTSHERQSRLPVTSESTLNGGKPIVTAKRNVVKNGRKKRKSSTVEAETTRISRQNSSTDQDQQQQQHQMQQQPIYMEVEDSGYTEESSTPSSGNNTNNHIINSRGNVPTTNNPAISPASTSSSSSSDRFLLDKKDSLSFNGCQERGPRPNPLIKKSDSQQQQQQQKQQLEDEVAENGGQNKALEQLDAASGDEEVLSKSSLGKIKVEKKIRETKRQTKNSSRLKEDKITRQTEAEMDEE